MPMIGFGTWGIARRDIDVSLRAAVAAGYRLFDLAPVYKNEAAVGETLTALISHGVVTRADLFLTSKAPPAVACDRSELMSTVRQTLKDVRTPYLDLYLVHWPFCVRNGSPTWPPPLAYQRGYNAAQLRATWATMEDLVSLGLVRAIGLSNLGLNRLKTLLSASDLRVPPSVLQVEHHPYNANRALVRYCAQAKPHPIRITAYSSLGSSERPKKYQTGQAALLDDPAIARVAAEHGASAATVSLAWALRHGVSIIPKSTHAERIASNRRDAAALASRLSERQMATLDALNRDFHYLAAGWEGYAWRPGMPLEELYDDPDPPAAAWGLWTSGSTLADVALYGMVVACVAGRSRRWWWPL